MSLLGPGPVCFDAHLIQLVKPVRAILCGRDQENPYLCSLLHFNDMASCKPSGT